MRCLYLLIMIIGLLTIVAGCSTVYTLKDGQNDNKIYSGTIINVRGIKGVVSGDGHPGYLIFCVPDLPFSFALDTLLLPYTIPTTTMEQNANLLSEGE